MNRFAIPLAAAFVAGILLPLPAYAAPTDAPSAVFQCSTRDGRTVFSDEPCVGAPQVRVWTQRMTTQGIERSDRSTSAALPANVPARLAATTMGRTAGADTTGYGPYVDCQRRGGNFELAARICHLPDDAARHMFEAK